jgi:hypothetical protein
MNGRREGSGRPAVGAAEDFSFAEDLEESGDDLFADGGLEDLEAKIERQAQLAGSGA